MITLNLLGFLKLSKLISKEGKPTLNRPRCLVNVWVILVDEPWELKVKTCKIKNLNIQAFWFPSYVLFIFYFLFSTTLSIKILYYIILLILIYSLFILFFYFYIISKKNKNTNNSINYESIIKDKEYILFKISLFKFYYSTLIILFIFIFKHNGLIYLINLNIYFIFTLFFIFFILFIFIL